MEDRLRRGTGEGTAGGIAGGAEEGTERRAGGRSGGRAGESGGEAPRFYMSYIARNSGIIASLKVSNLSEWKKCLLCVTDNLDVMARLYSPRALYNIQPDI